MKKYKEVILQDGVTLYFDDNNCCEKIKIEKDIDTLILSGPDSAKELSYDFNLLPDNFEKDAVFNSITTLEIKENVVGVNISNLMFPNIRKVISKSKHFQNGDVLKKIFKRKKDEDYVMLLNSFCKKKDEVLDLTGVDTIGPYALSGCESENIINSDYISFCEHDAFSNAGILKKPYKNGIIMFGDIIADINYDCCNIIIPDDEINIRVCSSDIEWSRLAKITVHSDSVIRMILATSFLLPEKINIEYTSDNVHLCEIEMIARSQGVQYINLQNHPTYKSIDGIIYSDDGKNVLVCPRGREGKVVIAEGTESISENVFMHSAISEVVFPTTMKKIGKRAFYGCENLINIDFGIGITEIGDMKNTQVFSFCSNLKSICFPRQVKTIGAHAFSNCGIETLELNEGLEVVGKNAFSECTINHVSFPESIRYIGASSFDTVQEITAKKYISDILFAIKWIWPAGDDKVCGLTINNKRILVPRTACSEENISSVNDILNEYFLNEESSESVMEDVQTLFVYGRTMNEREDLAVTMYIDDKSNAQAYEYIYRHSSFIIKRYIKEERTTNEILDFMRIGVIRNDVLPQVLEYAQEKKSPELISYTLQQMRESNLTINTEDNLKI